MRIKPNIRGEDGYEGSAELNNDSEEASPRTLQTSATDREQRRNSIVVQKNAFEPGREVIPLGAEDDELFRALDKINTVANGNLTKALLVKMSQQLPAAREVILKAYGHGSPSKAPG